MLQMYYFETMNRNPELKFLSYIYQLDLQA